MHSFNVLFSLQNHLAHCQFATVPCPQCQQSVKKSHLEEHTTFECQRRPVSCPDCVASFVYEEKEVFLTHLCRKISQLWSVSVANRSPYNLVWSHLSSMNSSVPLPVWCASTVTWISSGTRWVMQCLPWERPRLNQTCFAVVNCYSFKLSLVSINSSMD